MISRLFSPFNDFTLMNNFHNNKIVNDNEYIYEFKMSKEMARNVKIKQDNYTIRLDGNVSSENVTNRGRSINKQSLHQSFVLPKDVILRSIKASYDNNKLTIKISRKQ